MPSASGASGSVNADVRTFIEHMRQERQGSATKGREGEKASRVVLKSLKDQPSSWRWPDVFEFQAQPVGVAGVEDCACHDLEVTDRPDEATTPTGPVLASRSWGRQVRLAFSAYRPMDDYVADYLVFVTADGLEARAPVVCGLGGDGLSGFVDGLAETFRGWPGVQHWRSLEDQLRLEATWQDGGHVTLRFHVRPSIYDKWVVTVDVTLEAGEEMKRLSDDLTAFFSG